MWRALLTKTSTEWSKKNKRIESILTQSLDKKLKKIQER
jgi:hypothetical protein